MKTGYKQSEVGVIPEDWDVVKLTSVAKLESGHTPSRRTDEYWNGNVPWISLHDTDRLDGTVLTDTTLTISQAGLDNSSARLLPEGTVVLSRTATIGKTGIMGCPMATSQDFANYICGERLRNEFLLRLFQSMQSSWRKFMAGSTHNTIYMPVFQNLIIAMPPTVAEQRAIAEALSDADALIESLEKLIAKKRMIKQGAMQELLTGKRRLPGFSGEWVEKRLGDVAKIQRGASPRPIDSPEWFDENSTTGWVRISDVTSSGIYLNDTTQKLSKRGVENSRPVASGSLIMSICATVGRPIITRIDVCIHDGFVVFDALTVDQKYIYYVLKKIEPLWSRHGQTGSQMNLNTGLINGTIVRLPSERDEQTALATVLSDMDAEITTLETRLAKARLIKQGMMQELLTGRIRLV